MSKLIIFIISLIPSLAFGRFAFELGDRFRVLGDKGIKNSIKKTFEVQGNVVIINGPFTMYGGGSLLNFNKKTIDVWDNIRLSSSEFTIMAKRVFVDLSGNKFVLNNGRYEAGNRTLYGEKIFKKPNGEIEVLNGTFSTCQDCRRDWTFFGEEINITPNEYVKINSAYFMIRDVPIFYLPYLVFPIKKERESGLLFPRFSLNTGDGVYFQLPIFWAISDHTDITFSPGVFGDFSFGNEFEFRSKYSSYDQIELKHYYLSKDRFDNRIENNQALFFNNATYIAENLKLYVNANYISSVELFRSFNQFLRDRITNDYFGVDSSLSYSSDFYLIDASVYDIKNLLTTSLSGNDEALVQLIPRVRFNLKPISIFSNDKGGSLFVDFTSDLHVFDREAEDLTITRDYTRARNEINLFGNLNTQDYFNLDYQLGLVHTNYFFDDLENSSRAGGIFKIGISQSLFRDYFKKTAQSPYFTNHVDEISLIKLPNIEKSYEPNVQEKNMVKTTYFRHITDLSLNFFTASFYSINGDENFSNQQINNNFSPKVNSVNDIYDFLPGFEYEFGNIVTNQLFPVQKTLFFEVKNSFKKEVVSFNKERNINVENIGNINFSQGIYFPGRYSGEETKLTRFGLNWSLNLGQKLALSGNEFYFFDSKANLSTINLKGDLVRFSYELGLIIDDRTDNKNGHFSLVGNLTNELRVRYLTRRDFSDNIKTEDLYKLRYIPKGKCWFYELAFQETLVESRYFFNFALNYNEKLFNNLISVF